MRKTKILSTFIICLLACLMFSMQVSNVYAKTKNEVILNFDGGIIHDGYVEYSKIGKIQLFKGDKLVTNISNNMVIDLNEADYEFVIEEIEDTGSIPIPGSASVKLNINNWYYPMTTIAGESKSTFKLESSKFSETLDVKLERKGVAINTTVENVYDDITSTGTIDLTNENEYVIDFSKTDELTEGLKSFADLDKTLYYKRDNKGLLVTDNESEAIIKMVGNKSENKAILTAVNVGTKKSEVFKGFHMQYTGYALDFDDPDGGIILETRYDYYTRCTYEFTFQYAKEDTESKEYEFIEGANQIYTVDESKDATFRVDADYSLFANKVYIDDNLVDNENYDSKSGSTIVTLKDSYLKTLSVGRHTLKVAFSNGTDAITYFEIKAKQQDTNIEDNKNTENTKNEEKQENNNLTNNDIQKDNTNANPKTGDNVIVYAILFAIALIGTITLIIVNNTKRKKLRKY